MKLNLLIILSLILAINCKKKTEFIPFSEHQYIVNIDTEKLPIIIEPGKEELVQRKEIVGEVLTTDGVLKLIPTNNEAKEVKFYSIVCPKEWKCDKDRGYVREELIDPIPFSQSNRNHKLGRFLLFEDNKEKGLRTINWLLAVNEEFPGKNIDFKIIDKWLDFQLSDKKSVINLENIYYFMKNLENKITDERFKELKLPKNFSFMDREFEKVSIDEKFLHRLGELYIKEFEEKERAYFLSQDSWKKMVKKYNSLDRPKYLQEIVFQKSINTGLFSIGEGEEKIFIGKSKEEGIQVVNWKFKLEFGKGFYLIKEEGGEEIEIKSIKMEEKGETFRFVLNSNELILTMESTPDAFIGSFLKEKLSALPNDYKKIISENDWEKAVIFLALKFGKGGIDNKTGYFDYKIEDGNMLISLFKNHRMVTVEPSEIKGTIEEKDIAQNILKSWFQKYDKASKNTSIFINYTYYGCARDCQYTNVNEHFCFDSKSSFNISFKPSEIYDSNPKPQIGIDPKPSQKGMYICELIFNN